MSPLLIKICKDLKLVCCPRSLAGFTLITRTTPCLRQLPSCVAVYPRDSRSRLFYVADPVSSVRTNVVADFPMSPLLIKISKDFATIWTTIDPIGNVALFVGLTALLTRKERHLTALRAVIYASIILVGCMTIGQVILDAIGIHMHSLKVAGGVILFLFGVRMLFGQMDKAEKSPEEGRDLAVFHRRCLPSPGRAR